MLKPLLDIINRASAIRATYIRFNEKGADIGCLDTSQEHIRDLSAMIITLAEELDSALDLIANLQIQNDGLTHERLLKLAEQSTPLDE